MGFKNAVTTCFRKYATFSGRARRSEYWWFMLFVNIVSAALSSWFANENGFSLVGVVFELVVLLPALAVTWRRMHDIGKSGFWGFIEVVPYVGWIFLLVWTTRNSQPGPNRFGPNPKEDFFWSY